MRAALLAAKGSHSGISLAHEVVARIVRERSLLTEGGDRAHDDFRIDAASGLVVKPHPRDGARREIFDHHIHLRDQLANDRFAGFSARIETKAQLAAILLDEVTAALVLDERHR